MMKSVLVLLRPRHWLKNLMLLFPPFLGGKLFGLSSFGEVALPLFSFCCASSFAYVVNDLKDAEKDSLHPAKKNRPIPAGDISLFQGKVISAILAALAGISGLIISSKFLIFVLAYMVINVAYSFKLKEISLVDIFCVASGFLIRLFAGGEAFSTVISDWLFLSVFLLAIFLGIGKRLCERRLLGASAGTHRRSLREYPPGFLEGGMYLTGSSVLVTYTMYVVDRPNLILTVPICTFGLLRVILSILDGKDGDPINLLLNDVSILITGLIWTLLVGWSIYFA